MDFMQANAIYDGVKFLPTQPMPVTGRHRVVITFIEPLDENQQMTKKLPRSTAKGLLKDKVWMSDDFNEPLDEMREYMECEIKHTQK